VSSVEEVKAEHPSLFLCTELTRSVYLGTMVGRAAVVPRQKVQCCLLSNELKTHVLQTCTCGIKKPWRKICHARWVSGSAIFLFIY